MSFRRAVSLLSVINASADGITRLAILTSGWPLSITFRHLRRPNVRVLRFSVLIYSGTDEIPHEINSDWKHVAFKLADPDAISGCDFVGQAVEIGSEVPKEVQGTIRLGFVRGGKNKTNGAFAEYVKQEYDITAEVPKNITPAQAASAPIPCTCLNTMAIHLISTNPSIMSSTDYTACQALHLRLGIPRPGQDTSSVAGKWILIWSGSTAVGQYVSCTLQSTRFSL